MLHFINDVYNNYLQFFANFFDFCLLITGGDFLAILLSIIIFYILCQFVFFKKLYLKEYWRNYIHLYLNNIILVGTVFLFTESFAACKIILTVIFSYYLFRYCIFNNFGIKAFSSIFPQLGYTYNSKENDDEFSAADMIANGVIKI